MITLSKLLEINKEDFLNYKIHFAIGTVDHREPYRYFLTDEFKEWQEEQTKRNFCRKYILSLIYFDRDIWMFGGIYEVLPVEPEPIEREDGWRGWRYQTKLTKKSNEYIGRAFFKFNKRFRASYPALELEPKQGEAVANMNLAYILDQRAALTDFPGFDQVDIDYKMLKFIVSDNILSWKTALSNVKGVYLIVDTVTGKQYVGCAYGDECLWQRWSAYADNGHGDNEKLKELLKINGKDYRYKFKYSILEICNMNLGNEYIINRETHWKNVLMTRSFGLNKN